MKKVKVMGLINQARPSADFIVLLDNPQIKITGIAYTIPEAATMFRKVKPDVVVIDIDRPSLSGLFEEMAAYFKSLKPEIKLAGISDSYSLDNAIRIRNVQATGYICWNTGEICNPAERIVRISNGEWAINPNYQ